MLLFCFGFEFLFFMIQFCIWIEGLTSLPFGYFENCHPSIVYLMGKT